jgi:ferrous iron transport protein B
VRGYTTEEIFLLSESIVKECFDFGSGRGKLTVFLDSFLSSAPLSFLIFASVLATVFYLSFGAPGRSLGQRFSALLNGALLGSKQFLSGAGASAFLTGLFCDGFLTGLFAVLSFLPQLALLFFSLSLLEESGFLARAAMLSDSFFKRFRLSGRCAVSFLLGFGCTVPAIMSTRTIRSAHERHTLISILPFISCGARLPVYFIISSALFPGRELAVIAFLYALGTAAALTLARFAKPRCTREPLFFIELPEYRLPDIKSVARLTWSRVSEFFSRSVGVLSVAFSVFWVMKTYNFDLSPSPEGGFGMLGAIGKALSAVFIPAGFGFWQACAALLCGFLAKESIVGVLAVITGSMGTKLADAIARMFTPASALSFLVFVLLYTPCISTLKTMSREYKSCRKALLYTMRQLLIAYTVSVAVYNIYTLILTLF